MEITIEVSQLDELISLGATGGLIADAKTAKSLQSDIDQIQKEQAKGTLDAKDFKQLEKDINKEKGKGINAAFADLLLQSFEALESSL